MKEVNVNTGFLKRVFSKLKKQSQLSSHERKIFEEAKKELIIRGKI